MDYEGFQTLIAGISSGDKNTALEVRTLFSHFLQSVFLPGDIKMVQCTAEDLLNDYDATGLGLGKRSGWAKCNGLNGTIPYDGRTPIGTSEEYPIGQRSGAKTHQLTVSELPEHDHLNGVADENGFFFVYDKTTKDMPGKATVVIDDYGASRNYQGHTSKTGEGEPFSVMQPFVATLFLVKLP